MDTLSRGQTNKVDAAQTPRSGQGECDAGIRRAIVDQGEAPAARHGIWAEALLAGRVFDHLERSHRLDLDKAVGALAGRDQHEMAIAIDGCHARQRGVDRRGDLVAESLIGRRAGDIDIDRPATVEGQAQDAPLRDVHRQAQVNRAGDRPRHGIGARRRRRVAEQPRTGIAVARCQERNSRRRTGGRGDHRKARAPQHGMRRRREGGVDPCRDLRGRRLRRHGATAVDEDGRVAVDGKADKRRAAQIQRGGKILPAA